MGSVGADRLDWYHLADVRHRESVACGAGVVFGDDAVDQHWSSEIRTNHVATDAVRGLDDDDGRCDHGAAVHESPERVDRRVEFEPDGVRNGVGGVHPTMGTGKMDRGIARRDRGEVGGAAASAIAARCNYGNGTARAINWHSRVRSEFSTEGANC